MKKQLLVSLILAGSMVATAHADEQTAQNQSANTSTVKIGDVQKKDEQVGDIDTEITNAKMRADAGSKSKLSAQASLSFNGGNIEKPFGAIRPNYSGAANTDSNTNIAGTVGFSYRLTKNDSLQFGTGVSLNTPFQNTMKDVANGDGTRKTSISTPYASYSRSFRTGSVQNAFSVTTSYATDTYSVDTIKELGSLDVSHTFMFDIAGSNWQPGVALEGVYLAYNNGASAADTISHADSGGRVDYELAFYPLLEYAFNDRYSFRTVFRPFVYDHFRNDSGGTFLRNLYTQSLGIGIAVTRDIYLYPNLQFAPENLVADRTNVGLSTTINMF